MYYIFFKIGWTVEGAKLFILLWLDNLIFQFLENDF